MRGKKGGRRPHIYRKCPECKRQFLNRTFGCCPNPKCSVPLRIFKGSPRTEVGLDVKWEIPRLLVEFRLSASGRNGQVLPVEAWLYNKKEMSYAARFIGKCKRYLGMANSRFDVIDFAWQVIGVFLDRYHELRRRGSLAPLAGDLFWSLAPLAYRNMEQVA